MIHFIAMGPELSRTAVCLSPGKEHSQVEASFLEINKFSRQEEPAAFLSEVSPVLAMTRNNRFKNNPKQTRKYL